MTNLCSGTGMLSGADAPGTDTERYTDVFLHDIFLLQQNRRADIVYQG